MGEATSTVFGGDAMRIGGMREKDNGEVAATIVRDVGTKEGEAIVSDFE